ncbi:MAG: hypothetical protein H6818_00055 [Phycisphaerales bacterium]|nr:hypothetical protein [Phycisphaerales bacterium]MCB9864358.1 hypothetical protein [Phycisphaerales bacterium]
MKRCIGIVVIVLLVGCSDGGKSNSRMQAPSASDASYRSAVEPGESKTTPPNTSRRPVAKDTSDSRQTEATRIGGDSVPAQDSQPLDPHADSAGGRDPEGTTVTNAGIDASDPSGMNAEQLYRFWLTHVEKNPGWSHMGSYEPRNPAYLDIPKAVREKVERHLRERLGDAFYDRLKFTGGQMVDFDELRRVDPDSKNIKWTIHAYDLHYRFAMPDKGIVGYTAQIKLNADGSVLHEIDLPNFVQHPEKLKFLSIDDARRVAIAQGYDLTDARPSIDYDADCDCVYWHFERQIEDDGIGGKDDDIEINAHTGAVLRRYTAEWIR